MKEYVINFFDNNENPFGISLCGVTYPDPSYRINRRNSNIWCVEYIYSGQGNVTIDDVSFTASEGDVYILPIGKNHFYYSDSKNPWHKIWFNIRGDFIEKTFEAYGLKGVYHIKNTDVSQLFENFIKDAESIRHSKKEISYDKCAVDFLKIVQNLSQQLYPRHSEVTLDIGEQLKNKIDNITDFNVSFDKILSDFYYTKSHLIRIFKSRYGITPYDYLLIRKINSAKMLLSNTSMTIAEISDYLGFSDCHYFSNFFKKRTGVTPREYKNKSR